MDGFNYGIVCSEHSHQKPAGQELSQDPPIFGELKPQTLNNLTRRCVYLANLGQFAYLLAAGNFLKFYDIFPGCRISEKIGKIVMSFTMEWYSKSLRFQQIACHKQGFL